MLFLLFILSPINYEILSDIFQDSESDYTELIDDLENYRNKPLNINKATRNDFSNLLILNDLQIEEILHYRKTYGNITSINELKILKNFSDELICFLQNFVDFDVEKDLKLSWKLIKEKNKSELLAKYGRVFVKKKGFEHSDTTANRFLGSPDNISLRYRFTVLDKIKIGFNAAKHEGEEFFYGHQKQGFPVYSVFAQINDMGILKNLVVGHYRLQFGQGLTLWNGMSYGNDAAGMSLKKSAIGVKGVASNSSYGYLQGVAVTLKINRFNLTTFASIKHIDGSIADTNEMGNTIAVSSILQTGYKQTLNDIAKKNVGFQGIYGLRLEYSGNTFRTGITAHYNHLNVDFRPKIRPDNQFSVIPQHNINFGMDFEGNFSILRYFGEISMSKNAGFAGVVGSKIYLSQNLTMNILYRYYDKKFQNFFSGGYGNNNNESGLTIGVLASLSKIFILAASSDLLNRQWFTYNSDVPVYSQKINIKLDVNLSKYVAIYLTYKGNFVQNSSRYQNFLMEKTIITTKHNLRLNADFQPITNLHFITRMEMNFNKKEKGYLLNQTVKYNLTKIPLNISAGFAVFNVDNYDMRIYAYENSVLHDFSSQAFFDKGSRFYLLFKY
ncbi:MAG: helix-hairpin-helix domain-containing protein [Bacteroidales bacterium]|jgi:opacity protein-like surface antigen|nr:helix-hairpin-helix domain-containing protein [Bacteroidales bacterium]